MSFALLLTVHSIFLLQKSATDYYRLCEVLTQSFWTSVHNGEKVGNQISQGLVEEVRQAVAHWYSAAEADHSIVGKGLGI